MNKPTPPTFPTGWYDHCPKVLEARDWMMRLLDRPKSHVKHEAEDYADCAFVNAGAGKECENCKKFLTRPYNNHPLDAEWLPKIEKFYEELAEYDKKMRAYEQAMKEIECEQGAGI